jgi:hypothetical protein
MAYDRGIPTPRVLGEVLDRGNHYAFFEHIPSRNLSSFLEHAHQQYGGDYGLDVIYTADTETQYRANATLHLFPPELQTQLHNLWLEFQPIIQLLNARNVLGAYIEAVRRSEKTEQTQMRAKLEEYPTHIVDRLIVPIGFDSLDTLTASIGPEVENSLGIQFHYFGEALPEHGYMRELSRRWTETVETGLLGFSPNDEMQRLQEMLDQQSIAHGDVALRNILVEWDSEHDQVQRQPDGSVRRFIIDWESH